MSVKLLMTWYSRVQWYNHDSVRFIREHLHSLEPIGFNTVTAEEVFTKLKRINAKKSTGAGMIPRNLVKTAARQ